MESDIVSGQKSAWVLLKKLGEGDAGEVYLVESLLEKQPAILKRPVRSAFASDVIRQSAQITTESKILKALSAAAKMDGDFPVSVPEVLDQSKSGTAFSERLFIIIEKAPGFDLSTLARAAHMGILSGEDAQIDSPEEKRFLKILEERGQTPERVLLSALHSLLVLFEKIHQRPIDIDGIEFGGILWNDVKPEHIYWDPWRARLTVIDWGNGQLLERNGATRDRSHTAADDYRQWEEEMGRFLEVASPSLLARLEWPGRSSPEDTDPQAITHLQERIIDLLQETLKNLTELRDREVQILQYGTVQESPRRRGTAKKQPDTPLRSHPLAVLEALQSEIIGYGEMPNYSGALSLALSWAARFASSDQLADVEETCAWIADLPGSDSDLLHLVARLAHIAQVADAQGATHAQHNHLKTAVQEALHRDWSGVLWSLVSVLRDSPEPDWWFDLVCEVRRQELGAEEDNNHPLLVTRRSLLTLQSMNERLERTRNEVNPDSFERLQDLIRRLREDIVPNWASIDPNPPHAGLPYTEIDEVLDEIQAFLPEQRTALDRALTQPRAQVSKVMQDWEQGQFGQAAERLRQILLLDPDRKRVLRAEQAILQAPLWLDKVHHGPKPGEHYVAFVTEIEYEGRELRSQVGPAGWMDLILESCRQLRRGAWPPDLIANMPLVLKEMPWLNRYERIERIHVNTVIKDEQHPINTAFQPLSGISAGKLGPEGDLQIGEPLDGWVAEARGSSARVFSGLLRDSAGILFPGAIKLMRMDKIDYALPLFREEIIVLNAMRDVPGITPLYECGFINLADGATFPGERTSANRSLDGNLIRIGPATGQEFILQVEQRTGNGWIPYLAIEPRNHTDNLLAICDTVMTGGTYLPVSDLLLMAIQICDIMHEAHQRKIVYRDHKILHYYWVESAHGIYTIDWNVAKLHPEGLVEIEKQMDIVQFGARALHHILTGRTAPGALPIGPTRPEEIEQAAKSYQAQWTYDDQRLPEDVRGILERVLAGDYNSAIQLRDDLKQAFLDLPEIQE